jgi:hypothetical protein
MRDTLIGMTTSLEIALVIAAVWSLWLAAVTTSAIAVGDADGSRVVPAVAGGGVFIALAASLLVVAGMA